MLSEDETYSKITLGTEPTNSESEQRVLGVNWNFVEDQLVFDLSNIAELAKSCKPTSAKFCDPLGHTSPITVQLKHLFQELCKSKVGWDDEISFPRLELLSCLILARLRKDVQEALRHELELKDSVC